MLLFPRPTLRNLFLMALCVVLGGAVGCGDGAPSSSAPTSRVLRARVSGLQGTGLVLATTGGDELVVSTAGIAVFPTPLRTGDLYEVTVRTQPRGPSQTCGVETGEGTVGSQDPVVDVSCRTDAYPVGGNVSGLMGTGLVLDNTGSERLAVQTDGAFVFPTPVESGAAFDLRIVSQPVNPAQTCVVAGGQGTVGDAAVSSILVRCNTDAFAVGGSISGLSGTVVAALQQAGGDAVIQQATLTANGTWAFPQPVPSGTAFRLRIQTQPDSPSQTCRFVAEGTSTDELAGRVEAADIQDIHIDCVTNTYAVGGTATWLGGDLVLRNGAEVVTLASAGPATRPFVFPSPVRSGGAYAVVVEGTPSPPPQVCTVETGSGTVTSSDVTEVRVSCVLAPCPPGLGNCDGDDANGCETDTDKSLDHCGGCGRGCAVAGGVGNCDAGACVVQSCDAGRLDCDGRPDSGCEASTSSVEHCGGCGRACIPAHATGAACPAEACSYGACERGYGDCDGDVPNGCERSLDVVDHCGGCGVICAPDHATGATCASGTCGFAACEAGHGDCDRDVINGCETPLVSIDHCGACGVACAPVHSTGAECGTGTCTYRSCDAGFGDCDGDAPNGCERRLNSNDHCGGCGLVCSRSHAVSDCATGDCLLSACEPGYWDADGIALNGCEYACSFAAALDDPDDGFVDANCDGLDGMRAGAVFVAPFGSDSNPGTADAPMASVIAALTKAAATGKPHVYVSVGTYDGSVTLASGISIFGGYDARSGWRRGGGGEVLIRSVSPSGRAVSAMVGRGLTAITVVDRVHLQAGSTSAAGTSSIGLVCEGCTGLRVRHSVIESGNAGPGAVGASGATGAAGGGGAAGNPGACDDSRTSAGGGGGTSSCGRPGGSGGTGGYGSAGGSAGSTGVVGTAGGSGGVGYDGGGGSNGAAGAAGGVGPAAAGGSGGSVVDLVWSGGAGGTGGVGSSGNGGGGGGGGGGQSCTLFCYRGTGNGGGGGGGGGCGGAGGGGGGGGGASFAVLLVRSSGAVVESSSLLAGNGGGGGGGGAGGSGGAGGAGGVGFTECTSQVGAGGNGGRGGDGGRGGAGGGGAGGPSFALYVVDSTPVVQECILTSGVGGPGGMGATGPASAGASGGRN